MSKSNRDEYALWMAHLNKKGRYGWKFRVHDGVFYKRSLLTKHRRNGRP